MPPPPPITTARDPATGKLATHPPAIEALGNRHALKALAEEVTELHQKAAALAKTEAGRDIRMPVVTSGIKHIVAALEFAEPYAVCPYWSQCLTGCKACGGKGWVCRGVWDKIPKAVKGGKK